IPQESHGFSWIASEAGDRIGAERIIARKNVGIVVILEQAAVVEVAGKAVAFLRRVAVVQMRRDSRIAKADVVRRQIIVVAHQYGRAVASFNRRAGRIAVVSPDRLCRILWMEA